MMNQLTALLLFSVPFAAILVLSTATKNLEDDGIPMFHDEEPQPQQNVSALAREKRGLMCPQSCYGSCSNNQQCQQYSPSMVCIQACCCPVSVDLSTICDGGAAVAACINGLCGQGWFCNIRNYCCRCQSGNASGPCINGLCPPGYACNTNNYCCPLGSGSVLGPCVNGQCPTGYTCGAGNLCYSISGSV